MRSDTITMEKEITELEAQVTDYKSGLEAIANTDLTNTHNWFEIKKAEPPNPDTGGTLDRGIVARLEDGRRVVIGEIWAACPTENHGRISIDTDAAAQRVVDALNAAEA